MKAALGPDDLLDDLGELAEEIARLEGLLHPAYARRRELYVDLDLRGIDAGEIAEAAGMTRQSVREQLKRARKAAAG